MNTQISAVYWRKVALMVVMVFHAACTGYAFTIWNFLNVASGRVWPFGVFEQCRQLRIVQGIMVVLLIVGGVLYTRLRESLGGYIRWTCIIIPAAAIGHLGMDCFLRLLS